MVRSTVRRSIPLLVAAVFLLGWVGGCTHRGSVNRTELYRQDPTETSQHPVVVIPGTLGSGLNHRVSGENVWFDSMWTTWMGHNPRDLELPLDHRPGDGPPDDLRPGRLLENGITRDYYEQLVRTLEETGGYRCEYPDSISPSTDCVLFTWDWRRDLLHTVRQLDDLIERLRNVHGRENLTVDLVSHSAGGLIVRYYLRYGPRDVLDDPPRRPPMRGTSRVRKALLIAPPNFGSVQALKRAVEGQPIGLNTIQPETFLLMPGVYPLLPVPNRSRAIDPSGRKLTLDLHDTETWQRHRWAIYDPAVRQRVRGRFDDPAAARRHLAGMERFMAAYLMRAERFHRSLSTPAPSARVQMAVLGGGCRPTPDRVLIEPDEGGSAVRLHPSRIRRPRAGVDYDKLMLAPGDGSVTRNSLLGVVQDEDREPLFRVDRRVLICEGHASYTSSPSFQDNLLDMLLRE